MPLGLDFIEQIRSGGDQALPFVALQFESWQARLANIIPLVDSLTTLSDGYLKVATTTNQTTVSSVAGVPAVDVTTGTIAAARFPAFTGDVTTAAGSINTVIGALKVTNAMLAGSIAAAKLIGTDIATVGTLTAGATGAGFTVALSTSTITGTLPDARLSTKVPLVQNAGRVTAQPGAVASVATYTVGGADGSFLVSANVLVTASTLHNFTVTVAYTDESNTPRTVTLNFSTLAGVLAPAITNTSGAGPYEGVPLHIRAKASTPITIATTGTFTTVTYNAEGMITQVA